MRRVRVLEGYGVVLVPVCLCALLTSVKFAHIYTLSLSLSLLQAEDGLEVGAFAVVLEHGCKVIDGVWRASTLSKGVAQATTRCAALALTPALRGRAGHAARCDLAALHDLGLCHQEIVTDRSQSRTAAAMLLISAGELRSCHSSSKHSCSVEVITGP